MGMSAGGRRSLASVTTEAEGSPWLREGWWWYEGSPGCKRRHDGPHFYSRFPPRCAAMRKFHVSFVSNK